MNAFENAFEITGGGAGHYAAGLLILADGTARGVETITRLTGDIPDRPPHGKRATPDLLPPMPWGLRLALSSVGAGLRAGLGTLDEGIRPAETAEVAIAFADGTTLDARMPLDLAATIRHDAELVHAALARSGTAPQPIGPPAPEPAGAGPDEALTSIFRYEKRNGRLRRVPVQKD